MVHDGECENPSRLGDCGKLADIETRTAAECSAPYGWLGIDALEKLLPALRVLIRIVGPHDSQFLHF